MMLTVRVLLCWALLLGAVFIAPLAKAQTPSLQPFPEAVAGLWGTVSIRDGAVVEVFAESALEACRIQHQSYNPSAIFVGANNAFQRDDVKGCDWDRTGVGGPAPSLVSIKCPNDYQYRGGLCVPPDMPFPPICNTDCGGAPVSGTPQPNVGHPININSGLKILAETDYASADGHLVVDRQYLSRNGVGWRLLIPGYLEMGNSDINVVIYDGRGGSQDEFTSTTRYDPNGWIFAAPDFQGTPENISRRRLTMVTTPSVTRDTFVTDPNISPTGPAEMRLDMANGEYILFRRANGTPTTPGSRRLVPVEHGKPGGYKLWFDYNDTGYNPYRIRDSLNREMLLTWIDAPSKITGAGFGGAKVISRIQLPDTTRLDYTYDDTSSTYVVPIPLWAVQYGLIVVGAAQGTITVTIDGRRDRLRSVTRNTAAGVALWQRQFDYDYSPNPTAMTRIKDQAGATLSEYTYVNGELLASSKLAGNVDAYNFEHFRAGIDPYNGSQFMRRATNALGRTDDYWLYRRGGGISEANTLGQIIGQATSTTPADTRTFEYVGNPVGSLNKLLTQSVDQLGRQTNYSVDQVNRRPTAVDEAAGTIVARQTAMQWHPIWDLPTRVERDGVRVDTVYTADAMVASQTITDLTTHSAPYTTNGQARTVTYTWGANARLLSVNGPRAVDAQGRDDIVNFVYDTTGNVTTMTNALAHVTSFGGYDPNGRPATMTDPNGVVTQFTYDLLGRTTSVKVKHPTNPALDATTTFTYDIEGRVKTITAPASTALTMNYDLAGLLKSVVASNGERIDYGHDAMGNVTSQITKRANASAANTITNTFDALGRLLTETLGPGRKWTYAYDTVGNLTGAVSPRNQSTANSFDALDRLVNTALPDTGAPSLTYDQRDGVSEHQDPLGVTTTFVRNGFGEAIQEVNPDRGTSIYYYNSAGDKTAGVDGRGQRIDYAYDILGRLLTATPVANPATTYVWDTAVIVGSYAKGRLSSVVDSGTTIEYKYDHRGNAITKRQRIDTGAWMQLAFTYDLADRRTQITYPSGRIVNYTFNTLGRVTQVRTKATSATTAWTTLASGMTYEAFGAITRANYGNGTRMIQSWGNDGRLANRRLERSATSVRLSSLTYGYDNSDNFTSIADTLDATKSRTYAYDAMDRLTRITGAPAPFAREDYVYDKNGNRLAVERRTTATTVAATQTDTYTIAANTNRLTSLATTAGTYSYSHDGRGNQSVEQWPDGSVIMVAYDGFARLTRYKVGLATQDMRYNGADERISVVTTPAVGPSDTRIYMYDLDHRIVGEYGAAGVTDVKAEYIWTLPEVGASGPTGGDDGAGGYMPLAIVSGTTPAINWVHSHHNAKPILLTNATGTVVAYTGHAVLGFPGQFANAVGLAGAQYYYNRYRDYNDVTGRYIQADPIGLAGDANPYAYAMGNTLRYMDPTGELAWLIPIAVGFAGGLVFDAALEQYKKMHCTCRNGASNGTPFGPSGNAALGTAAGGLARAVPKPRGGIAGGGNSGPWTSSASTLNHRWSRLGAYSPTTRRAITAGLRRGGKMIPYLGAAIAAYQIHDAVSCK